MPFSTPPFPLTLPFPHQENRLLSTLSTLGIGGPARFFAEARSAGDLQKMILFCKDQGLGYIVLGKGSNILFDDRGFNGLVIASRIESLERTGNTFSVGAGFSFARLGLLTAREHLSGLEFAAGIPASVGGAVFMNAGANGQETQGSLVEVDYIDEEGRLLTLKKEELAFGYRFSSFQQKKGAIVSARFLLAPSDEAKKRQEGLVDYRLKTQPYKDKSAGCAFRNPIEEPAGRLIESLGLKGFSIGGASVSTLHANFIVNRGGATSADVKRLIELIQERARAKRGLALEVEIRFIPYEVSP